MNRLTQTFRSLKYRNFRLFFPGLMTSQVGIWVQNVAISWVVYSLTKSPFMMGGILFINTLPLFLVTPFAGMIIDKFDRHKLLMMIQVLFALQAFLMALFAMSNHLMLWNIIVLGLFLNIIAAIDAPLRQSTYILLVDDNPKYLQDALPFYGYNVTTVTDGEQALKLLAKSDKNFDLILFDVMMKKINGWDTLKNIRKNSNLALTCRGSQVRVLYRPPEKLLKS